MSSYKYEDWSQIAKLCLSEAVGTGFLVIMSCLGTRDPDAPLVEQALSVGFAVTAVIHGLGHISGAHVNPSVTLAAAISGSLPLPLAPLYIVSQILGGVLGSVIFSRFCPDYLLTPTVCVNLPHPNLSACQALLIEMTTTSMLILANCATWDPRNFANTDSNPIKFGVLVSMVKLTTLPLTGASMNPASAFGPVLWNNYWDYHWIYWVGPLSSAAITSLLYKAIYGSPTLVEVPK